VPTTGQRRQRSARAGAAALGGAAAPARGRSPLVARFAPSRRSIIAGLALAAFAAAAYLVARDTGTFAVRRIEVTGAPPAVAREVEHALAPLVGKSLVALDAQGLERHVDALPSVVAVRYDRAFPHTLRVSIVPERGVGVLRSGSTAWLVSARGRVIARIARTAEGSLPRIWLPAATRIIPGAFLAPTAGGDAARALGSAGGFPARIRFASSTHGAIDLELGSGLELRLGDPGDIRLKLAVARRALPVVPPGTTYLDVSLPGRPVAGGNPLVSGGG
jgi:cell division protein FtsQ